MVFPFDVCLSSARLDRGAWGDLHAIHVEESVAGESKKKLSLKGETEKG